MVYWRVLFQAEDGIRDLVRSRGRGDVYKRQGLHVAEETARGRETVPVRMLRRTEGEDAVAFGRKGSGIGCGEAQADLSLIHI